MGRDNMRRDVLILNMEQQMVELAKERFGSTIRDCRAEELYDIVMEFARRILSVTERNVGEKKVYYLTMEFVPGKLLENNLINLRLYDRLTELLKKHGRSLSELTRLEPEPALGSGGLGRLSYDFLDSISTLGLPGEALGLHYHFGHFKQTFENLKQVPQKDEWLIDSYRDDDGTGSWEKRSDVAFDVDFGSRKVLSRMINNEVAGYDNGINMIRLFDLEGVDESLVTDGIHFDEEAIEQNLTLFVYPDDSTEAGRKLRIYQEYFLACSAAQWILREMKARQYDLRFLYNHAVIQISDTHPTMIIPELIRIMVYEKAMNYDEVIDIVSKTCAYTNYISSREDLEYWPMSYLQEIVPQLVPIIEDLDRRVREKNQDPDVAIIQELNGQTVVNAAHIDLHYTFSVSGTSRTRTRTLTEKVLHKFSELYPDRFDNKTNGISFRRWLLTCNHELANYLSETILDTYKKDASALEKLLALQEDQAVLAKLDEIKTIHKRRLCAYLREEGIEELTPDGIFDMQISSIHEFKRQQLNALYIIDKYLEIKAGKVPVRPLQFVFAGKADPADECALRILHLLLVLQEIIRKDEAVRPYLKMVFAPNYSVSLAELLIPAADVSEQISLASRVSPGTGGMKMMLSGAVTLGTPEGINDEILELVGSGNIYLFGLNEEEVIALGKDPLPADGSGEAALSDAAKRALAFLRSDEVKAVADPEMYPRLMSDFASDRSRALRDLEEYIAVKNQCFADYEDRTAWQKKMLVNIAMAGYFSADRTVVEYNREVWHVRRQ